MKNIIDFLSIEFTVMLTAALPIVEVRGAIPLGMSFGLSAIHSAILGVIGSAIPIPFILLGIKPVFKMLKQIDVFKNSIERLSVKTMSKSVNVQKYGFWGLLIFVAIPLPGTGVWTGSLIAALLDMRFKIAFLAIFIGNIIAAFLIMSLSYGLFNVISGLS